MNKSNKSNNIFSTPYRWKHNLIIILLLKSSLLVYFFRWDFYMQTAKKQILTSIITKITKYNHNRFY